MFKMVSLSACRFDDFIHKWVVERVAVKISDIYKIVNREGCYLPKSIEEPEPSSDMYMRNGEVIPLLCDCDSVVKTIDKVIEGKAD